MFYALKLVRQAAIQNCWSPLPPTQVTKMTPSIYDMLGWEADPWIPARRIQTGSIVKVRGGEEGVG